MPDSLPTPGTFFGESPQEDLLIELANDGPERFRLLKRIGYVDHEFPSQAFIVPDDLSTFTTDLTSTPRLFTWLVPKYGIHLPAALVHDAFVVDRDEKADYIGPPITREQGDRIFRDAMKSLGTPPVRRWLIWSAVVLATAWIDIESRFWWRLRWILTVAIIASLGTIATLDLLDIVDWLPWMGSRPFPEELFLGGLFAILIPAAISAFWGRLWAAALIASIAFALLIHVTLAIGALLLLYRVVERVATAIERRRRSRPPAARTARASST